MPGGIAKAGVTGQSERWPGNYQWQWHPMNQVWTFDKGGGRTHTRFGRFVDGRFVTGKICLWPALHDCLFHLLLVSCNLSCCLLLAARCDCCVLYVASCLLNSCLVQAIPQRPHFSPLLLLSLQIPVLLAASAACCFLLAAGCVLRAVCALLQFALLFSLFMICAGNSATPPLQPAAAVATVVAAAAAIAGQSPFFLFLHAACDIRCAGSAERPIVVDD